MSITVARWCNFIPEITNLAYFGGPWIGKSLVSFMAFWYIFPVLVCCAKKNLSTLVIGFLKRSTSLQTNRRLCHAQLVTFQKAYIHYRCPTQIGSETFVKGIAALLIPK
jgi:hypothetical protein